MGQRCTWRTPHAASLLLFLLRKFPAHLAQMTAWRKHGRDRELHIPKGARLALKNYLRPTSSLQHLLHVVRDQELPNGCFEVKPCDEEGFYFKIHTADDLFPFLQHAGESKAHRKSVLTHVASRCFEILARDYGRQDEEGEDGSKWESFRNLVALAGELQRQGLPVWDEDGFAADKVSTQLYPHSPPMESESE